MHFSGRRSPGSAQAIHKENIDLHAVAALTQPRCEILSDLPEKVSFLETLPDYDLALYTHKKSKSTAESSLAALQAALPVLEAQKDWSNSALYEVLLTVVEKLGVKNSVVLWPIRVAVSGLASTPGGATELCSLLGKEESIRRILRGIARLSQ